MGTDNLRTAYNDYDLIDMQMFIQHNIMHCPQSSESKENKLGNESFITVGGGVW